MLPAGDVTVASSVLWPLVANGKSFDLSSQLFTITFAVMSTKRSLNVRISLGAGTVHNGKIKYLSA